MREQPWMRHVTHQMTTLILGQKDACKSRLVLNLSQAKRIECAVRAVIKLCCTDVSCEWVSCLHAPSIFCGRGEGVQGVLTLFCSGAAQVVCHALRVVELREQLEVEEEDGDRQEEKEEVESGEGRIKEMRP